MSSIWRRPKWAKSPNPTCPDAAAPRPCRTSAIRWARPSSWPHMPRPRATRLPFRGDGRRARAPAGLWHAEWNALPSLFGLVSGALREARTLAEGLVVDADRMRANIDLTRGLLFADAAAGRLGARNWVGRQHTTWWSTPPRRCGGPAPRWRRCWLGNQTGPRCRRRPDGRRSISPRPLPPRRAGSIPRCAMPRPSAQRLRPKSRCQPNNRRFR